MTRKWLSREIHGNCNSARVIFYQIHRMRGHMIGRICKFHDHCTFVDQPMVPTSLLLSWWCDSSPHSDPRQTQSPSSTGDFQTGWHLQQYPLARYLKAKFWEASVSEKWCLSWSVWPSSCKDVFGEADTFQRSQWAASTSTELCPLKFLNADTVHCGCLVQCHVCIGTQPQLTRLILKVLQSDNASLQNNKALLTKPRRPER